MTARNQERWLSVAAFLSGLLVIVPFFLGDVPPAENDPIAGRLATGNEARWGRGVAGLYYDDAFYYLRIAQHLAAGSGSTFDGETPTNGYHPLWLLCLVPFATGEPGSLLLISFVLQALAAALVAVGIARLARRFVGPLASGLAVLLWLRFQCTYWMSWSGMEYGLQALAIVSLLVAYLRRRQRTTRGFRDDFTLGALGSLAVLARLDNLLLVGLVGLAWAGRHESVRSRWRSLLGFSLPTVLAATIYVSLNLWHFGLAGPVSGAVKRVWSAELLAADPSFQASGWLAAKLVYLASPLWTMSRSFAASLLLGTVVGLLLCLLWGCRTVQGRRSASTRQLGEPCLFDLWPLAAFGFLQYLAYGVVFHGGYSFQPWYFVAQPLFTALLLAVTVDRLAAWAAAKPSLLWLRPWAALAVLVLVLGTAALNTERRRQKQNAFGQEPLYVAAGWIDRHFPKDATIGAWNAGILGFFSGRRVVNLDGLVSSRDFFLEERHDLCAYLEQAGIDYLVDVFEAEKPFARYESALGHCRGRFERIWDGPAYAGSSPLRRALAFEWRGG